MHIRCKALLRQAYRRSIMTDASFHEEGLARIHLPKAVTEGTQTKAVFLNPVQHYNRDLSVVAIRTFSEMLASEKLAAWGKKLENRKAKKARKAIFKDEQGSANKRHKGLNGDVTVETTASEEVHPKTEETHAYSADQLHQLTTEVLHQTPEPYKFTLFEGLSATGLRSIRYALELPLLRWVLANDLSRLAVENIRQNLILNGLPNITMENSDVNNRRAAMPDSSKISNIEKVRVNEGDCCTVMYNHRSEKDKFDVVDLDPYGTAAPFLDAAVQCVADGGLLCVTCTDGAVLAGTNYPEKCYSNYGGTPVRGEFSHEVGIRLILHSIASCAARYGLYIKPQLSLSIDFYFRVFVRVFAGAKETKETLIKTGIIYTCSYCQSTLVQRLGKVSLPRTDSATPNNNVKYSPATGMEKSERCEYCDSTMHLGGPMWIGPLHDTDFVDKMLQHADSAEAKYETLQRIKGMITLARNELPELFYFTPSKICGAFHASAPSIATVVNGLLNMGYKVSRSHAASGSIKTSAPREDVMNVFRAWIETNPVKMGNVSEQSPARQLLAKSKTRDVSFEEHSDLQSVLLNNIKLVRYQVNPLPNFGPGTKAITGHSKSKSKS